MRARLFAFVPACSLLFGSTHTLNTQPFLILNFISAVVIETPRIVWTPERRGNSNISTCSGLYGLSACRCRAPTLHHERIRLHPRSGTSARTEMTSRSGESQPNFRQEFVYLRSKFCHLSFASQPPSHDVECCMISFCWFLAMRYVLTRTAIYKEKKKKRNCHVTLPPGRSRRLHQMRKLTSIGLSRFSLFRWRRSAKNCARRDFGARHRVPPM